MRKNRVFSIFYSGRHEKPTETNIMRMIAPSILGVAVCIICLAGMTWAWFSDTGYRGKTTLTGANFNITAVVKDSSNEEVTSSAVANRWELGNGTYTVTLTATGTSRTGGYGLVTLAPVDGTGKPYSTVQLYTSSVEDEGKTKKIEFTVTVSANSVLTITPQWGQAPGDAKIQASGTEISDSSSTGPSGDPNQEEGPGIVEPNPTNPTEPDPTEPDPTEPDPTEPAPTEPDPTEPAPTEPDPTEPITDPTEPGGTENPEEPKEILYTVQPGDRLGSIASQFGLTWPELAEYNGIEHPDHIEVGQVLRIPPVA